MIDHLSVTVANYELSKVFYSRVLATLGHTLVMEPRPKTAGFGSNGKPTFWIAEGTPSYWSASHGTAKAPVHIAFTAQDQAAVDAFYAEAIAAGAKDFGGPGPRPHYHPGYYGAFVLDPDGNNIEAVIHDRPR
jgi:catechol 2,3-dioxygenase-like lactoylglutathione lyase family enzyme